MDTAVASAPVAQAPEAPAPQAPAAPVQTQEKPAAPSPEAPEGVQVDRAERLAEIQSRVKADPEKKLNDEDLAIWEEGEAGKLKPKAPEPKVETKVEAEKKAPIAEDAVAKALKEVGAKTVEELPAKIQELRKALSGKDAQAVASLTKERDTALANLQGATRLIEDLKAGKPEALGYLRDKLGVKFPESKPALEKPFAEEDDLLVGGALSKLHAENQTWRSKLEQLEAKIEGGEKARTQEAFQTKAKSQVVDEILGVAQLIPELQALPNLRNRVIDFQAGKEDADLQVISDLSDLVVKAHQEKGFVYDLETAYHVERSRHIDVLLEKARDEGRKEAYNHKPNKSMSSVATEDPQPETITDAQIEAMGKPGGHTLIPDAWYDKDGNLDRSKVPKKAWPALGL